MNQTVIIANIFERVFNSGTFFKDSSSPPLDKDKGIVRPFDTGPAAPPFYWPASTPIYKGPNLRPVAKGSTVTPSTRRPTTRQRWELKPPDKEVKPTHVSRNTEWNHSSNLENLVWVALGGFVILVLLAIFMKLGNPIRRVRRQVSNARRRRRRPSPNVITRRQDPDDRNSDMGSLIRLTDTAASTDAGPLHDDLPPPYSECVYTNKHDTEEPPPRFSACFVTYTNTKDTEPKVHIQRQNGLFEDESFVMNDSEDIGGMRTELVLVDGRIVERPKLDLINHNNETEVASNDKVKESRHAHFKGRVVYNDETNHVKVNIY